MERIGGLKMNVIKNLVPVSKYSIKCPYPMDAEVIVVHNTANDATAKNEIAYMIRNDNQVSYHYAIDDKEIIQAIPEDRNAWHTGDGGTGKGNRKGIGIEICYSKSGGQKFIEAEKLTAKFIAFKLNEKGWGIDRVKKHQDFAKKYCPHRTLDMGWQRFLNMIQAELNLLKGVATVDKQPNIPTPQQPINNNIPSTWATEDWNWGIANGLVDGTNPKNNLSREQFVAVLHRFMKMVK